MGVNGKPKSHVVEALPSIARLASSRAPAVHMLLLVDHDDTRDVLDILRRTDGYEVTPASDGPDGVDKSRQRPADIVLVDIFMPRKNGVDTIRELVRDFPDAM